jgi:hypothetical protein
MKPPNANDALRTTDHTPDPAPADGPGATDAETRSFLGPEATGAYRPGAAEEARGAAAGRDPQTPAVPGYDVLGVLGRGGMGVVYKARHLALKRTVALKMVLAGGHVGPAELARFRIKADGGAARTGFESRRQARPSRAELALAVPGGTSPRQADGGARMAGQGDAVVPLGRPGGVKGLRLHNRLEAQVMQREAAALLGPKT